MTYPALLEISNTAMIMRIALKLRFPYYANLKLDGKFMGTDIHVVLQKSKKGIWKTISALEVGRNYSLFGILAGVRSVPDGGPISEPRGLPSDLKYLHKLYADFSLEDVRLDGVWLGESSYSWLSLREILRYYAKHWTNSDSRYALSCLLDEITPHVKTRGKYRIVFGFDS